MGLRCKAIDALCATSSKSLQVIHVWLRRLKVHGAVAYTESRRVAPLCCRNTLGPPQVWAKTPGLGESPFLECLWSSIDDVRLPPVDSWQWQTISMAPHHVPM